MNYIDVNIKVENSLKEKKSNIKKNNKKRKKEKKIIFEESEQLKFIKEQYKKELSKKGIKLEQKDGVSHLKRLKFVGSGTKVHTTDNFIAIILMFFSVIINLIMNGAF